MTPPPQLGLGVGLPRGGMVNPYLLNQNLLLASQYEPGGWLYENHSRDTGATVVDENGNVVWAPENLLDNPVIERSGSTIPSWGLSNQTAIGDSIDPEGNPVVEIEITGSNSRLYQSQTSLVIGQNYALEFVVASDNGYNLTLFTAGLGDRCESISTADGSLSSTPTGIFYDAEVDDLGGGFYRYRGFFTADATSDTFWLFSAPVPVGETFFVGSACLRRVPSAGRLRGDSGAGPFFAPRLQHDSSGTPLGYLHEPQATNIATDSVDFSGYTSPSGANGYQGTGIAAVMTPDYGTAPDGTDTATRVQLDLNGGSDDVLGANRSGIYVSITSGITTLSDYASSLYIKPLNGEDLADFVGYIGLIAGGAVATPTNIEAVANGWYRVFYASTPTGTTGTIRLQLVSSPGSTFDSLDCLIWGMQVELGAVPTSYIPTYGLPATRQVDEVGPTAVDIPAGEWTAIINTTPLSDPIYLRYLLNMGGPGGTSLDLFRLQSGSVRIGENTDATVVDVNFNISPQTPAGSRHSIGVAITDTGSYRVSIDGSNRIATTSTMAEAPQLDTLSIASGNVPRPQVLESIRFYRNAKSSDELDALTSA